MARENKTDIVPEERAAIVGSRAFPNSALETGFIRVLPPSTIVVSGGARGVDQWAADAAVECGLEMRIFRADWNLLGRRAGPIRNAKIVTESGRMVAFWDGRSRGTLNTILTARDRGIPIEILGPDGQEIPLLSALVVAEEAGVLESWYRAYTKAAPVAGADTRVLSYCSELSYLWPRKFAGTKSARLQMSFAVVLSQRWDGTSTRIAIRCAVRHMGRSRPGTRPSTAQGSGTLT